MDASLYLRRIKNIITEEGISIVNDNQNGPKRSGIVTDMPAGLTWEVIFAIAQIIVSEALAAKKTKVTYLNLTRRSDGTWVFLFKI